MDSVKPMNVENMKRVCLVNRKKKLVMKME